MFKQNQWVAASAVVGTVLLLFVGVLRVDAQNAPVAAAKQPAAKDVVLVGRVVDLHCFMTGKMPTGDPVKCTTECLRAGVPAGLVTESGIVVLGHDEKGPSKLVLPYAYQEASVKGQLFEKSGVKYLNISAIEKYEVEDESEMGEEDQM